MYTLVSGASSGIGLELAKLFAEQKKDLILVARSKEELNKLAEELRKKHDISVEVIVKDLSVVGSAQELFDEVQAKNVEVETIINNAGFGDYGKFAETSLQKERAMMQLNMITLTELCKLFVQPMVEKKQGTIVNVASTAAFQPGPLMAVYFATKAYVLHFSEAIQNELQDSGVHVMALCPGPTRSGFQEAADMEASSLVQGKIPTAKDVAEFAMAQLEKKKVVAVHGWKNKLLVFLNRTATRNIVVNIVRKLQD